MFVHMCVHVFVLSAQQFNDNINTTLGLLNTLGLRMPPLPVQVS
jgi:hypothetical protein